MERMFRGRRINLAKAPFNVGGQAVLEGVMMRAKDHVAVAVRKENGDIVLKREECHSLGERFKILKIPLVRGFVVLLESLIMGVKALNFSANQQLEGEEEDIGPLEMAITLVLAFGFGILLFVVVPTLLANFMENRINNAVILNLLEGIIRLVVFLLYIMLISRMKDIQRVFQYHGAEHKTVFTFEAGEELTVENARKYSTLHPRCGTGFLLIVVVVSIIMFSFLRWDTLMIRILTRMILLPVVAGISYEIIKLAGCHRSGLMHCIIWPGLMLQKLTTQEPDDQQLEVAIAALKEAL